MPVSNGIISAPISLTSIKNLLGSPTKKWPHMIYGGRLNRDSLIKPIYCLDGQLTHEHLGKAMYASRAPYIATYGWEIPTASATNDAPRTAFATGGAWVFHGANGWANVGMMIGYDHYVRFAGVNSWPITYYKVAAGEQIQVGLTSGSASATVVSPRNMPIFADMYIGVAVYANNALVSFGFAPYPIGYPIPSGGAGTTPDVINLGEAAEYTTYTIVPFIASVKGTTLPGCGTLYSLNYEGAGSATITASSGTAGALVATTSVSMTILSSGAVKIEQMLSNTRNSAQTAENQTLTYTFMNSSGGVITSGSVSASNTMVPANSMASTAFVIQNTPMNWSTVSVAYSGKWGSKTLMGPPMTFNSDGTGGGGPSTEPVG